MAAKKTYEELVRQEPGSLVEKLVKELAGKKAIDVQFETDDDGEWAAVKTYEEDTETAVRLLEQGKWVLQFGYYDDDDEFIELLQPLTQAEVDKIPGALQKVMLKVLASEEGLRLPVSFLSK